MCFDFKYLVGVMNLLSNAFSVLTLDAGDDKEQIISAAAAGASDGAAKVAEGVAAERKDKSKKSNGSKRTMKDVSERQSLSESSSGFKNPLVWIDLEMTGLDIQVDRILEIACIITDGNLTTSVEGPDLVIHQSSACLDKMGEWCQVHHGASGLTTKVLQSTVTERDAEKQVMEFVKKHVGTEYKHLVAGNSVYVDLQFLKKYMPNLADMFSHVVVDVSSVKALCIRWYPRENKKAPQKAKKHRAMDDIKESIMELKYFKQNIFKASKSGR